MDMKNDKEIKEYLVEEQKNAAIQVTQKDGSKVTFGFFARATPEDVDLYHKMELGDLIELYAGLYFTVAIYGQSSIVDCQCMDLIEREIYEFRDETAQIQLENRIKEMVEG
jgi:uncharacterized protein YkvS